MKNWIYNSAIVIESYLNYFKLDPTIERIQKSPLLGYYINKPGKRVCLNRKRILKNTHLKEESLTSTRIKCDYF